MITGNHDPFLHAGTCQFVQLSRRHGEVETPAPNQPPCGARGRRLLGPAALRTCPFTSLLGQVRMRLGPGGYYRRSGNGGPQTCLPAACGMAQRGAQHDPSSSTQAQDPREGPSLAGWSTRSFLRHGLIRLAREEAERSRRGTSRGAHDASHDDQGQASARRAPACAGSLFPLWCKGGKHRPRHQAKVTVLVQKYQDQQDGRMEVIVEPKTASPSELSAGEDYFCQDSWY